MSVASTDRSRRATLHLAKGGVVSPSVEVVDAYWGYIIASPLADRRWAEVGQTASWIAGMAFMVAAVGLWLLPGASVASDVMAMKFGLSAILGGIASLLIWYASRGVRTEIQVDTKLGEIREIVRNSAGRTSLISKLRFDMIGGVFLDRTNADKGETALLLRFLNTPKVMLVAVGPTEHLEQLRNRLGRDLLAVTQRQAQERR
ncbi:MAG TPA: hypothetical protein VLA27_08370 [Paracoccaceae bacterium]|nr:hypothetical protein [Paracoccaceae bacterium]